MTEQSPTVVEFTVGGDDDDLLAALTGDLAGSDGVAFGPVREVAADSQLYFDLAAATDIVKSVTAVISGAAGVAKVVEFVVGRLTQPKKRIVVTVGTTTVTVTGGEDPHQIRSALRAALKLADA